MEGLLVFVFDSILKMNRFQSILDAQKANFFSNATKTYAWRIEQLERMERLLIDRQSEFKEALHDDFGKPPAEQVFELSVPLGVIKFFKENLKELMEPEEVKLPLGLSKQGHKGMIYREPFGPTLVIGPFNAPIILLVDPAVTALAAGNPVVLKPANSTANVASLFRKYIPQYFEPESVSIVTGGRNEISALLELPFDFIFFTGSSRVGKIVMKAAADNLTPVILELGGQNPTIVDDTANLDAAAKRICWGHNAISGQWCVAPGYVYVHEDVATDFIDKLCAETINMYGRNPQRSPDFARMITEQDAERVASYIIPEKVVLGGRYDIKSRFVEPTYLYPSTWDDPAMQQEVFGPVLPILPYNNLIETIEIIKSKPRPLAGYIFSENQENIQRFINSIPFGGGCINHTNLHSWIDALPFGGVGYSGMGKYYGKAGFDALSNTKSLFIGTTQAEIDVFPPYAEKDVKQTLKLFE